MSEPFFTVIIPTYNRADMLQKPISSVVSQTFGSWELIIVDDGSTDDTKRVVESFHDERIRYIYQQNQERSAARNTGIKNARGQYICFLDSDDYYLPDHLESFHKKIVSENSPVAVFYSDTFEDVDGNLTRIRSQEEAMGNRVEWVAYMTLGTPRTCSHRSILEKHQFNPLVKVGEDVDLWVRAFREFPVIYTGACTVVFVTHPGRTVHIGNEQTFIDHITLMERIFSEDHQKLISKTIREKILSRLWFRLGQHYAHVGEQMKAVRCLLRSIFIDPQTGRKEKMYLIMEQIAFTRWLLGIYKTVK